METEILVIGAGIAGLMTALSLAPKPVILLSKGPLGGEASTTWAQGGISAAMSPDDSPESHRRDTMAVAGGLADEEIVKLVTELGPNGIETLSKLGVLFDRDGSHLDLRKEAAHSHNRVVHANGDSTGKEIMRALKLRVLESPHITVLEKSEALELIVTNNRVVGAFIVQDGNHCSIEADAVVLACGGIGQIYSVTTNPFAASGDGLAMAARAGAVLTDLEFVQFHPTAINVKATPLPLATEALRGEGAYLVNDLGERFMLNEKPLADLASRDIVARGIWRQMEKGQQCFLDTRHSIGAKFPEAFPTVFNFCQDHKIDPRKDLIPVAPAAHYHMGGVAVNQSGQTSIAGLWACGEVACTGLHGANRLASNSLLEALVFAPLVAADIKKQKAEKNRALRTAPQVSMGVADSRSEDAAVLELQSLNYQYLGLCRDRDGLNHLLTRLDGFEDGYKSPSRRLTNILICSRLIATAALNRRESRGSHYRSDYPNSRSEFSHHSHLTLAECQKINRKSDLPLAS